VPVGVSALQPRLRNADVPVGGAGGERELEPAVVLLALDEGVAEEDDPVAVAEFKARWRGGADGSESEEGEQGGAEERAHREGVQGNLRKISRADDYAQGLVKIFRAPAG